MAAATHPLRGPPAVSTASSNAAARCRCDVVSVVSGCVAVVASSADVAAAQGCERPVVGRRVVVAARELHYRGCRRRGRVVERGLVVGVEGGVVAAGGGGGAVEDELREGPQGGGGRGGAPAAAGECGCPMAIDSSSAASPPPSPKRSSLSTARTSARSRACSGDTGAAAIATSCGGGRGGCPGCPMERGSSSGGAARAAAGAAAGGVVVADAVLVVAAVLAAAACGGGRALRADSPLASGKPAIRRDLPLVMTGGALRAPAALPGRAAPPPGRRRRLRRRGVGTCAAPARQRRGVVARGILHDHAAGAGGGVGAARGEASRREVSAPDPRPGTRRGRARGRDVAPRRLINCTPWGVPAAAVPSLGHGGFAVREMDDTRGELFGPPSPPPGPPSRDPGPGRKRSARCGRYALKSSSGKVPPALPRAPAGTGALTTLHHASPRATRAVAPCGEAGPEPTHTSPLYTAATTGTTRPRTPRRSTARGSTPRVPLAPCGP